MSAATDQKRKLGLLTSEERSSGGADSAFGRQLSARHATEPCFGFGTATRKQAGSINAPGLKPFHDLRAMLRAYSRRYLQHSGWPGPTKLQQDKQRASMVSRSQPNTMLAASHESCSGLAQHARGQPEAMFPSCLMRLSIVPTRAQVLWRLDGAALPAQVPRDDEPRPGLLRRRRLLASSIVAYVFRNMLTGVA